MFLRVKTMAEKMNHLRRQVKRRFTPVEKS
jgi:hypothetical protein